MKPIKHVLKSVIFLLSFSVGIAQTSVSGNITDTDGNPIPGVTVIVEGSSLGTTTDFDGNYTIAVDAD